MANETEQKKSNKMADLRDIIFTELRRLQEPDGKVDIDRAQAVAYLSQTAINSAKAEIEYMKLVGADRGSAFLEDSAHALPVPVKPGRLPAQAGQTEAKDKPKGAK